MSSYRLGTPRPWLPRSSAGPRAPGGRFPGHVNECEPMEGRHGAVGVDWSKTVHQPLREEGLHSRRGDPGNQEQGARGRAQRRDPKPDHVDRWV